MERPLVAKLEPGLWEVRTTLRQHIARVVFTVAGGCIVPLHGFFKTTQRVARADIELARKRRQTLLAMQDDDHE